jgi:bifunctional DNA-binding transcriptional regulator/antitoxin component of YhaV-PrlF toxin-antitoxin module
MTYTVTLSSKNQVTLPVALLKENNIREKSKLIIYQRDGQFIIETLDNAKERAIKILKEGPVPLIPKKLLKTSYKGGYKEMAIKRYEKFLNQK